MQHTCPKSTSIAINCALHPHHRHLIMPHVCAIGNKRITANPPVHQDSPIDLTDVPDSPKGNADDPIDIHDDDSDDMVKLETEGYQRMHPMHILVQHPQARSASPPRFNDGRLGIEEIRRRTSRLSRRRWPTGLPSMEEIYRLIVPTGAVVDAAVYYTGPHVPGDVWSEPGWTEDKCRLKFGVGYGQAARMPPLFNEHFLLDPVQSEIWRVSSSQPRS